MPEPRDVIIRPIITEKTTGLLDSGQYTFEVDKRATKHMIKDAIEEIFGVKVKSVNTMRYTGKRRRLGVHEGKRKDWKKAVVTLEEGQRIELFEGM
ncbi:MAG: 50S ribosomal protein L23 [Bacillota bacterium]|jgi:large subunit ribosomal protein L23|nr:50S ribosomal protein L23 [Bacillota bacterium]HOB91654.1 50S ribosomal protein L23 [Bacillota bacterium]HPZ54428.1 50S ribosomal protein L23 [Bacillota bacterium]HQD17764.1 50S ribosomal protein L23 [Bacillota bacterium]